MAAAACTNCGSLYVWPARRGFHLSDYPSPCCHAAGRQPKEADYRNTQLPLSPYIPTDKGQHHKHKKEV